MRIVIAPDSFKESLGALEVASAIEEGLLRVLPDAKTVLIPVADGGEGTLDVLIRGYGGQLLERQVTDALGRPIFAQLGLLPDGTTAVVEVAQASGLERLKPEERDPMKATSFGTGELIREVLDAGADKILIGLGGSATCDGGMGIMSALGVRFLDQSGAELSSGGGSLSKLARIDFSDADQRLSKTEFLIACDADNPLTGPEGTAAVFSPQKGATSEEVTLLESALCHYASVVESTPVPWADRPPGSTGRRRVENQAYAGAAGGIGFALMTMANATARSGIEQVLNIIDFEKALVGADLVITGEGCMDAQTAHGKTPVGVARAAKKMGIPVVALCGSLGVGAEKVLDQGIDAYFSVVPGPVSLSDALKRGHQNLVETAANVCRALTLGGR